MPRIRRTQPKPDQEWADRVTKRYIAAAAQRRPRVVKWDESYDAHDPQWIDETKVTSPPKVKFPYLNRVTESQTTIVMDATDASPRWLVAQPVTDGFDDVAEAVTDWLEYQYRRKTADLNQNARDAFWRWANMGLKYGNSYMYAEWDDDIGGIRFIPLDPYDVYLDGRYGSYVVVRRVITLNQLFEMARSISAPRFEIVEDPETGEPQRVPVDPRDGGRAMKAAKRIERLIKQGFGDGYIYRATDHVHGNSRRFNRDRIYGDPDNPTNDGEGGAVRPQDDPYNATLTVLEYYETSGTGAVVKVIPFFGEDGDSLVLQRERNPWGVCPIVPFIPRRVDNEYYGQGNGELVGKIADAMDYNFRAQLAMIGSAGWPPLLVTRGASIRKQFYKSIYGLTIPVRNIQTDIGYLNNNITPALHSIGQSISMQAADFVLGESQQRRGQPGADSATEAAILETAGNLTDRAIFRKWNDAQEQLGHVCLNIARVHMTESQVVPVLGRRSSKFRELRPEILRDTQWAVIFGGSPHNPRTQIATHLNILQVGSQSGELDVREILREVYRLNGSRDPDQFLVRKDPVEPIEPKEEEFRLLMFGQEPEISMEDRPLQHLQAHMRAIQKWTAVFGPMDDRVKALTAHFQAHMMTMQPQGGGMPGAGGGLPSPLMPQQVGTQGQPASMQPAFADLNNQRQMSNNGAGGQAPGPTGSVPGRQLGQVLGNGGL